MRRNIFDILEEEMNLEYEIETIVNLFNEARIYGFNINYSIEDYFDQECIDSRKARGEWDDYGRPAVMSIDEFSEYYQKVMSGEIRPFELMKQLGMSKSTYYRYVKRIKE